jgi:hypothetical protein
MDFKLTLGVGLGIVLCLAGSTVATPTAGVIAGADAPFSKPGTDTAEVKPAGDPPMPPDRTLVDGPVSTRGGPAASESPARTTLNVTYTFRREPDRSGIVGVTMRLPATPAIEDVSIAFPEEVTVVEATNVDRAGSAYEWTGERPAEIDYRVPINATYVGNRAPSWTLLLHQPPSIDASPSVDVRGHLQLAGKGYVANRTVLLGEHDVYRRQAEGQQIRVVVPENVTVRTGIQRRASALATAARSLSIGGRDEVLHAVVTPEIRTEATQLFQPGFSLDDTTLLIDGESEFDVWTHEYVHARQEFPDTGRLRWLTEGSAEYYGWLLSIEGGDDDWTALRGVFARGADDDSVLANPETWRGETDYTKGALVLGVLDHEIRVATDGERTLEDVFRRINRADADPTLETFLRAVRDVGGPDAAAAARRYVTTSATPDYRPDASRFDALYSGSASELDASPRLRTRIRTLATTGANGSRQFDPERATVRIRAGQSLRIRGRITNAGDAGGLASLAVRESAPDTTTRVETPWVGWLRPEATVTRNETVRFDRPGTYEVAWGDRQYTVQVVPVRGTELLTGVDATLNRTTGQVVVSATVRNDGDRSAFVDLPVSLDGKRVRTVTTVVDAGTTRTVTVSLNSSQREPYNVSVGETRVTVGEQRATTRPATGQDVPVVPVLGGLGVLAVLGGVAWWILVKR